MGPHVYTHPLSSSSSVQSPDLEGLTDASRRPGPGPGENLTISTPPPPCIGRVNLDVGSYVSPLTYILVVYWD